jgi:dienelactone hydrolase
VVRALRKAGKEFISIEMSDADHGFFCEEQPACHPQHAKEAWGMLREFLAAKLK